MYYPDLSLYGYLARERNTLNIGWLDSAHTYVQGDVPEQFIQRLKAFLKIPLRDNTLGGHRCELCNNVVWTGEIRVLGQGETAYAAPTMIYHYVVDHHYAPPEEFIQAVLTSPLPDSEEYRLRAQAHPWGEDLEEYYAWLQRRNESS